LNGEEDILKLAQTIETYFKMGGLQIQFNLLSYETLLDARNHPELYTDLLVRVSGYSAFFNDLSDAMKEEIITRTQYDLASGRSVPLPIQTDNDITLIGNVITESSDAKRTEFQQTVAAVRI
jgi:hypothetical protein